MLGAYSTALGAFRRSADRLESVRRVRARLDAEASRPSPTHFYVIDCNLVQLADCPDISSAWDALHVAPGYALIVGDNGAHYGTRVPAWYWDGARVARIAARWAEMVGGGK